MSTDENGMDPATRPSWANEYLKGDAHLTLEHFQRGLTVDLIATERPAFVTCEFNERVDAVADRNRRNVFDFLPVTQTFLTPSGSSQNRIIGLIELVPFRSPGGQASGLVSDYMKPLSEENLIGADASILTFVRGADDHRCCLVVAGRTINGLVSISDLQKLPVRAALFAMVTHFEIVMAASIREEFEQTEHAILRLSPERQTRVSEKCARAKRQEAFIDALLYTDFSDKVTIIKKRANFPWSKTGFQSELEQIQELRNQLAHASEYAATRADAIRVCETVRLIDKWIRRLTDTATGNFTKRF